MISPKDLEWALDEVEEAIKRPPYVSSLHDPYKILVSTVLSARTKDEVTGEASKRLFLKVRTVEDMRKIPRMELKKLIYPVCFYRNKSKSLKKMAEILAKEYGGKVPDTIDELVRLPGVGRKTANLVLIVAFDKPGVCVDTHVHRICNRWELVYEKTPHKTEMSIRGTVPQELWNRVNALLVPFGKEICRPISPLCNACPLNARCPKRGVKKHR